MGEYDRDIYHGWLCCIFLLKQWQLDPVLLEIQGFGSIYPAVQVALDVTRVLSMITERGKGPNGMRAAADVLGDPFSNIVCLLNRKTRADGV